MNDINVLATENNSMGKIEFFNQHNALYSTLSNIILEILENVKYNKKE